MNNTVILVGRLTKNPEIRYTTTNKAVCEFTLAVTRDKDNTDFIRVQTWNKTAEAINKYCKKGDMIGVGGSWKHETYEDKDGNKRSKDYVLANNITFLSTKKEEPEKEVKESSSDPAKTKDDPFAEFGQEIEQGNADDLPF